MKRALIDPRFDRVCEIIDTDRRMEFAVAPPLFWTDAPDAITDRHTYVNGAFVDPPAPAPAPISRLERLEAALIEKGIVTEKDIDDVVVTRGAGARNLGG